MIKQADGGNDDVGVYALTTQQHILTSTQAVVKLLINDIWGQENLENPDRKAQSFRPREANEQRVYLGRVSPLSSVSGSLQSARLW